MLPLCNQIKIQTPYHGLWDSAQCRLPALFFTICLQAPPHPQCLTYGRALGSRLLHWLSLHLECSPTSSTAAPPYLQSNSNIILSRGKSNGLHPDLQPCWILALHPECRVHEVRDCVSTAGYFICSAQRWLLHLRAAEQMNEFLHPSWFGHLLLVEFLHLLCNEHI